LSDVELLLQYKPLVFSSISEKIWALVAGTVPRRGVFFRSGRARNFPTNQRLGRATGGLVMEVRMTKAVPGEHAETNGLMAGRQSDGRWTDGSSRSAMCWALVLILGARRYGYQQAATS